MPVASVCTALGFVLGVSEEVKAATLSLEPTITFAVTDYLPPASDGLGDAFHIGGAGLVLSGIYSPTGKGAEIATLTEINIGNFSFAPNSITSAIFRAKIFTFEAGGLGVGNPGSLGIFGYRGNGTADASDFEAGVFLNSVNISSPSVGDTLSFDVSPYVNQRVRNGDAFAGFGIRALNLGGLFLNNDSNSGIKPRLIVETTDVAEQGVPEPTTILTATVALGWGGWLKRKNSSQQNKTKSQG